ncbi:MAG: ribonuclease HII [Rhodobacteraceae bacterium]|nr:ribonuclease HII [Paracoccaceae bacterium]
MTLDKTIERLSCDRPQTGMLVAGVDEAGRGPIAGPVVAAAVLRAGNDIPDGIADSKTLSRNQRELLYGRILDAFACSVAFVDVATIDRTNILSASMLAMRIAVEQLRPIPDLVLVDGAHVPPGLPVPGHAMVRGDARHQSIGAASILAKVVRDRYMQSLSLEFPQYGWERNAGYPTGFHLTALKESGVTRHHRRTFRPVAEALSRKDRPVG